MSTIQPTAPTGAATTSAASIPARITAGAETLATTRPGGSVPAQVSAVSPQGQITLSTPNGEVTAQAAGRVPASLKPGDAYTIQTGPRGSDTVSLAPRASTPPPPPAAAAPAAEAAPPPRPEGQVPARLVPGALTTATIIPRPADAPPPQAPQVPASGPLPRGAYAQPALPAPNAAPQGTLPAPSVPAAAGPVAPSALSTLARSGTDALLRTALQAARVITDAASTRPAGGPPQAQGSPPPAPGPATAPAGQPAVSGDTTVRPQAPGAGQTVQTAGAAPARAATTPSIAPPAPNAPAATTGAPTTILQQSGTREASNPTRAPAPQVQPNAPPSAPAGSPNAPSPAATAQATGTAPARSAPPPAPAPSVQQGAATATNAAPAPATNATSRSATAAATSSGATTPQTGTITTGGPQPAGQSLPLVQRADVRILSVHHPGGTASNALVSAQGPVLSGTVVGTSSAGQAILTTPQGLVTLAGEASFPPGSRVSIELLEQPARQAAAARLATPPPAPLAQLARHWETLDQAIRLLEVGSPAAASQIVQNQVARPGPQLSAAIALFITAVRGGDLRAWLGQESGRAIDQLRGQFGVTLQEEFGTMQRASEPTESGWRAFFIPVMDENQLHQIRLFLHQDHRSKDGGDGDGDPNTRFVVDLSLSELGDLQIDGKVKANEVDLLIRTHEALPDTMRRDIYEVFTTTLARTGIEGHLAFTAQKSFPTLPIEELHGYQEGPTSDLHI